MREAACWPWRHRWGAIAVDRYLVMTKVLQACERCGKQRIETLDGTWSLEQVRQREAM